MKKLIDEVLYSRRLVREGCFVTNVAALELERIGTPALSAVEQRMTDDISRIGRECVSHQGLSSRLSGLDNLLRYYLRVGLVSEPGKVTEIISRFPPALLSAVLDVSCLAFREVKNVSPQLDVPREFAILVTALASAENEEVKNSAQRAAVVFQKLSGAPPTPLSQ